MRPPYCDVCGTLCDMDGAVSFRKRPSDEEWDRWMEKGGGVGHPPYLGYFCPEHIERARKLADWTIDRALEELRR